MYKNLGEHINDVPKVMQNTLSKIKSNYEKQTEDKKDIKLSFEAINYENGLLMMFGYLDKDKLNRLGKGWGWEDIYVYSPNYKEMYYAQVTSKKASEPTQIYYNDKKDLDENTIDYDWFKKYI